MTNGLGEIEFEIDEIQFVPQTTTQITDQEDVALFEKFHNMLDDLEDVQNVFHNAEIAQ